VENELFRSCDTVQDLKSKTDEIIRDTISTANKFNEELRQDNRELIDKATALYRQDKMDKEYLDNYSREQEK
jgi:uncharacterized membrane protein